MGSDPMDTRPSDRVLHTHENTCGPDIAVSVSAHATGGRAGCTAEREYAVHAIVVDAKAIPNGKIFMCCIIAYPDTVLNVGAAWDRMHIRERRIMVKSPCWRTVEK